MAKYSCFLYERKNYIHLGCESLVLIMLHDKEKHTSTYDKMTSDENDCTTV